MILVWRRENSGYLLEAWIIARLTLVRMEERVNTIQKILSSVSNFDGVFKGSRMVAMLR